MEGHTDIQQSGESVPEQFRLERIKKYIATNLSTNLNAASVAEKFEISVSSLLHIFRKYQQQRYQQYVEEIRVNKAFDLITQEGYRAQQAMYAVGYKYRSTFNAAFKRKFTNPPSHFQK